MSQDTNQEDTSAKSEQPEVNAEEKLQSEAEIDPSESTEEQENQTVNQVEELQQKLNTLGEQLLREQAEMQNVRRRAQRDVESAHKFALEKFRDSQQAGI